MTWKHTTLGLLAAGFLVVPAFSAEAAIGKGTPFKNYPVYQVGARPIGMGGAFLALADDVSATYWNPAGLAYIQKAELTIQGHMVDYEYERIHSGTFAPRGLGSAQNPTPPVDDVRYKTYDESAFGPSLIGFVYPNRFLSVGFSIARIVDYEEEWTSDNVRLSYGANMRPMVVSGEVKATNLNLSFSRFIVPNVSLGLNLKYTMYEYAQEGVQFASAATLPWKLDTTGGGFAFDVGVIWAPLDQLSVAAVFKYGEQVKFDEIFWNSVENPVHEELKAFPHKFGVGAVYFIRDNFTVSLDAYYVMASSLAEHVKLPAYDAGNDRFSADDGVEVRLGAEYILYIKDQHALSFRAGGYIEPNYTIIYERTGSVVPSDVLNEDQLTLLFPEVDDETHITAGLGYAFLGIAGSNHSLGIDLAANLANTTNQYVVSLFWRFGGGM